MTEDERKNRNPAVEVVRTTLAEIEAMPAVTAAQLELNRVYVIQGARNIATLNYGGATLGIHPVTLDAMKLHHFFGPRMGLHVFLAAREDGSFTDVDGTRIVVRLWTGEDA